MTPTRRTVATLPAMYLAVLAVAVSSSDRIDLAGGGFQFKLTPFLALSPMYLALASLDLVGAGRLPKRVLRGRPWLSMAAFVLVAGVSVLFAQNDFLGLGPSRYLLLVYLTLFATVFVVHSAARRCLAQVLSAGAGLGLAIYVVVSMVQLFGFISPGLQALLQPGGGAYVDLTANLVGGANVPRLSGLAGDPNRGAVSAAVFAILQFVFAGRRPRYWVLILGGALVLLSWSRTGLLFYAVALSFVLIRHPKVLPAATTGIVVGALLIGIVLPRLNATTGVATLIEARTSLEDVSTVTHFLLIQRAVALGFETDLRTSLLGVGYGTEYSVTQEFFPDSKYANFHSSSLSVLAQTGLVGLLLFVLHSCWLPLRKGLRNGFQGQYAAAGIAVAYFVAGFFYQYLAEPLFWLTLAIVAILPAKPPRVLNPWEGPRYRSATS